MSNTKVICPKCGAEIAIAEREHTVKNAVVIGKDSGLGVVELPLANQPKTSSITPKVNAKAQDRINALKAKGVDTSNLFAMQGANGGEAVARLVNGVLSIVPEDDPIFKGIFENGTIPDRRLFRRWVMSQMFQMLSMTEWRRGEAMGFTAALHRKGYEYQWSMLVEELRVQAKLFQNDMENYHARHRWFNRDTAVALADDYMQKLKRYVDSLSTKKCKGVPYKTIKRTHIFVADLDKKVYQPLQSILNNRIKKAETPQELYNAVVAFNRKRTTLSWKTQQCAAWIDAYKGAGAYFTLQNLIRFHGCSLRNGCIKLGTASSLDMLELKAREYYGEGWRMLGLLKKVLVDNNVNIEQKRKEWREAKRNR